MELLPAGVDTAVIALWLGHENVETTQIYLHAHLALKEAALAKIFSGFLIQAIEFAGERRLA